jgi:putative hemolysin
MKPKAATGLTLIILAVLTLAACVPVPPPAAQAPVPVSEWQLYTDAEAGFSIQMPSTWSSATLPDQNGGAIQGTAFTGPEGGVEVYWGVGFGGACPGGTEPVQLAQGELPACHTTTPGGAEVWSQIGYEVSGGNSFSVRAYTSDAQPASHELVLQVLATLTFMPPAQPQAGVATAPANAVGLRNPASENCIKQGGKLSIVERGDSGQYGICLFEDNRQCEEWAMMRGDCPVGGIKVTGYVTPAAQYCAITGGTYAVTGNSGAGDEQGTCTFKDGSQCDAWDYYNGKCVAGAALAPSPAPTAAAAEGTIQPLTMEVCDGQAQAMAHALDVLGVTQSQEPLSDFVTGASGTGCMATVTGTGEQFESPDAVVNTLGSMLEDQGWTADPMLAAGGPNAIDLGYRKGNQICWAGAGWRPDESANCPKDQPVSACEVTPEQQAYTVTLNCGVETPQGGVTASAAVAATQVITYVPGPPTGQPQEGICWTNSLAVWREDAWRCAVGNEIYDPCFSSGRRSSSEGESVICGADPVTPTVSFLLTLTEALPAPEVPPDTAGHAWQVELAGGTVCGYATGATGGVGDERINYFCPSPDPNQSVVILGDLQPGAVWMAKRAVLTGDMPDLTVLESAEVPIRTVWR